MVSELSVGCLLAGLLVLTSFTLPDYAAISATVRAHVSMSSMADFLLGSAAEFPGLLGFLAVFMKSKGLHVPITVGVLGGVFAVGGDFLFAFGVKLRNVWFLLWGRMVAEAGHLMAWFMAFPILALTIYSPQQTIIIFTVVACERCFVPTLAYYWHYWLFGKLHDNLADTLLHNAALRIFFPAIFIIFCWYVHAMCAHRELAHGGMPSETTTAIKLRSICLISVMRSQLVCPPAYWLMVATMVVVKAVYCCFSELEVFSRVYNDSPAQVATEVAFGRGVAGVVCFFFTFLYMQRVDLETRARFNAQVLTYAMVLRWLGFMGVWLRILQTGHHMLTHEQFWVEASLILGQTMFDMWANQHLICLAGSGVAAAAAIGITASLSSAMTLVLGWLQTTVFNAMGIKWLTGLYAATLFFVVVFTIVVWVLTPASYPGTLNVVPGIASQADDSGHPLSFLPSRKCSATPCRHHARHRHLRLPLYVLMTLDRLGWTRESRLNEDPASVIQECLGESASRLHATAKATSATAKRVPARRTHCRVSVQPTSDR